MTLPAPRRYDAEAAAAYALRSSRRDARERALLARVLGDLPRGLSVLDLPCGTGRLEPLLGGLGFRYTGCDLSREMLRLAGGGVQAEAARLPFRDRSFDLVLCFRFLHHLPPEVLPLVLAELARVSAATLVLSFFHPWSAHCLARRLLCLLKGRQAGRYSLRPARLRALLGGFGPGRLFPEAPFLRELWVGRFTRQAAADGASPRSR